MGRNPKNVTDSVCLMREEEGPPLSNEFPPETAHLLDSGASRDFKVISSLQTIRKDKSFKVWDHHGNDSNSLPCPGFRMRGTDHGIPLKLAKASRPAGSPILSLCLSQGKASCSVGVAGGIVTPPEMYVPVLIPGSCEYDLTWKKGLCRCN